MITKINKEDVGYLTDGTYRVGTVHKVTYDDLIKAFGKPTYMPEDSGDGKVNFEWVLKYENNIFTIYDWKTYDENYTKNELTVWSIGGRSYAGDFENEVTTLIQKNREL